MKFGNATLDVSFTGRDVAQDIGDDFVGGGTASVSIRDYMRVWKRNGFDLYSVDKQDLHDRYKDDPAQQITLDNDDLIVFLNAIRTEPRRKFAIEFDGLAFWFWHDLSHAERDVTGGSVYVDAIAENRNLYHGAILAAKQGVPIREIVQELVKAEKAYRERFTTEPNALDRFLSECKIELN